MSPSFGLTPPSFLVAVNAMALRFVLFFGVLNFRVGAVRLMRCRTQDEPPGQAPGHKSSYVNFMKDEERCLFVVLSSQSGESKTKLDVFDPNGRYLGALTPYLIERRPPPVVRRNRIYLVTKDQLDVPYVVALRIERRE